MGRFNWYDFSKGISPCKDCKRRFVGCHMTCDEYKKYREAIDNEKKNL